MKQYLLMGCIGLGIGCQSEKADVDSGEWWANNTETQGSTEEESQEDEDKSEDEGTQEEGEDKPDTFSYEDCAEGFEPSSTCVGSWEETICIHDALIWWCEDGIWVNENEK